MSSLTEIREGLAAAVSDGVATEMFTYARVADVQQLPALVVIPEGADFAKAFKRGLDDWDFHVYVLVSRTDSSNAQETLDRFLTGAGPDSVREALYNNPTLGLADTDAFVQGVKGYGGEFQTAKVPHLGAIIKVCVRTDGAN